MSASGGGVSTRPEIPRHVRRSVRAARRRPAWYGARPSASRTLAARGWSGVNPVLSGLPFASLPAAVSRAILAAVSASLVRGGTFTTFQYVHAHATPPAATFRQQMTAGFGPVVSRQLVVKNFPPAYVMTWRK